MPHDFEFVQQSYPLGGHTLHIKFARDEHAILERFIEDDGGFFIDNNLARLEALLTGAVAVDEGTGNSTSWVIDREKAILTDLFAETFENYNPDPMVIISTTELRDLVATWHTTMVEFARWKAKDA